MSGRRGFTVRTRARLRAEILEAAAAEIADKGRRGLRMQAIAGRVGAGRQPVNNEFSSKDGLAQALVLSIAEHFRGEHERIVPAATSITEALRESSRRGLTSGGSDPTFGAVMIPDGGDTFLPLYTTSERQPLLDLHAPVRGPRERGPARGGHPPELVGLVDVGDRMCRGLSGAIGVVASGSRVRHRPGG